VVRAVVGAHREDRGGGGAAEIDAVALRRAVEDARERVFELAVEPRRVGWEEGHERVVRGLRDGRGHGRARGRRP